MIRFDLTDECAAFVKEKGIETTVQAMIDQKEEMIKSFFEIYKKATIAVLDMLPDFLSIEVNEVRRVEKQYTINEYKEDYVKALESAIHALFTRMQESSPEEAEQFLSNILARGPEDNFYEATADVLYTILMEGKEKIIDVYARKRLGINGDIYRIIVYPEN